MPMEGDKKLYDLLEVPKDADEEAIKKAYKKLAVKWHPDKHQGASKAEAEERFKEISRAYSVLSNPEKRAAYDRYGEDGINGSAGPGPDFDPSDIFSHFFGGGGPDLGGIFGGMGGGNPRANMARQSSPDKEVHLNIDLTSAYKGVKIQRSFSRKDKCPDCEGRGCKTKEDVVQCTPCKGTGMQTILEQMGPFMRQSAGPCRPCGGKGSTIKPGSECAKCRGAKSVNIIRNYTVDILAGTLDGYRFTFKGESDWLEGYGGVGDLVFVTVIDYEAGSNIFKREGVHLVVNKQISLVDSLCGVNFGIKHLDNRIIQVTHAGILKTGDSLVANGEGMPVLKENRQDGRYVSTGQRGNMIIRFTVVYPSTFSDKQREALRKVIKANDPQINQSVYMNVNVDGLREQAVQDPQILERFKIVTPTLVAESVPDFSQQQHNRQHARAAGPAGGFPNGFMPGMAGEMPQGVQCAHQ